MKVIVPGHRYQMDTRLGNAAELQFYFDGLINMGRECDGVLSQEVIRVLIDRLLFLEAQMPAKENTEILLHLRHALRLFEVRAVRRSVERNEPIEQSPVRLLGHWHK